jgi:hypothetical protein
MHRKRSTRQPNGSADGPGKSRETPVASDFAPQSIKEAAEAGAPDRLTAALGAWLAHAIADGAAHAACEGTPDPSAAAFVATRSVVEMYSTQLGFSPESARVLADQAAYVASGRAAALYSRRSMKFQVRVDDALLPEEKKLLNKPGRSDQERRALRDVIVRECILLGKPLPALVERYDLVTTGGREIARKALKVKSSAELVAYFDLLRIEGMSVKQADIQTAEKFQVNAKTVQRHRKKQEEAKSGHL